MRKNSYIHFVDSVYVHALNFVMLAECLSEKRTSHMFIENTMLRYFFLFVHVLFFFYILWVSFLLESPCICCYPRDFIHLYTKQNAALYIYSWVDVCILSFIRIYSWHTNRRVKEHHVPREAIFWFSSCCSTFVDLLYIFRFSFSGTSLAALCHLGNPSTTSNMLILSSFMIWMVCMC